MELTATVNTHSRVKGNELAKGFYPTFPSDIEMIKKVVNISFGYDQQGVDEKRISIIDPCAGEGSFLSAMARHVREGMNNSNVKNCSYGTYAIELDADRFTKIRGTEQKLNTSFFDATCTGGFDLVLLNPPYNKHSGELINWVEKAAPMVTYRGVMVLIIPEYELKGEMIELLRKQFTFCYAYKSEAHDKFKQVVVFLAKKGDNKLTSGYRSFYTTYDNLDNTTDDSILTFTEKAISLTIDAKNSRSQRPLLQSKELTGLYESCEERLAKAASMALDKQYPSNYDTSIQPASTLRTAHAVQLAAMNSQIESITINGTFYLAKYMVINKPETYDDYDADTGMKTETIVYKPTVETFLMDEKGEVKTAREHGFDYVELNSQLSTILLTKLTKMYIPLHEVGQDEEYLAEELKAIGLKAPQREAVKAVMKSFASGRKGIGIRANTGTGKTWMAKAVKYIAGAKRTIMVTEPQLVPQMVKEYETEGFDVHVIDSWESLRSLARTRPKGLYLIAYTRLRMHPEFVPVTKEKRVKTKEGIKSAFACMQCNAEVSRGSKGSKEHCPSCNSPLYTYIPENKRPPLRYKQWIGDIERNGTSIQVKSQNKQLPYIRFLKQMQFDLAIFDEAHNAANLMSNQGTAFIRLAASARKVLCLTATVTNGMAKSLYNLLWGINPVQMRSDGWNMKSATDFQAKYGAFKEVRKSDERNRHRDSEQVKTYDTAGISPAALVYTLPNFVNVDSEDFDDLPPVEREVVKCASHPEVETCIRLIEDIIAQADLPPEDRLAAASVRNAAFMRVSDTFKHSDDEICLRGYLLGTLRRVAVNDLLEKESQLVKVAQQVVDWGERLMVYTGNTQKIDMRGPLRRIIAANLPGVTVEVLPDSVAPDKLVGWFEKVTAQIIIVSFHRVATGLNLSQFNNLFWYDYTDNTRLAEQGEGRIRRVNTADIHRKMFGSVRPCRYWYATSSPIQEAQLAYTLEKRMIAKLAEGETPDIDPAECTSGNQSFSAIITRALREGSIDYQDPSVLLKKMTKSENAGVRADNFNVTVATVPGTNLVIISTEPEPPSAPLIKTALSATYPVIYTVNGREQVYEIDMVEYMSLRDARLLEETLFGIYASPKLTRKLQTIVVQEAA